MKYSHYSLTLRRSAPDNLDPPTNWQKNGACRNEEFDLHFPAGTTGIHFVQAQEAKAVCRRCPVMERCAAWALQNREPFGIWGGIDEDERRSMLRRLARDRTAARKEAAA
ncbi:WhiB family transcriptional regulator [Streptomyces sp. NPDC046977]|uniref:WhiB family transcriptional regulator n=1 Tax=Streptomyces sp. NPDC046977 TaxID=3154703 RepID=UPI0033DE282D